MAENDANRIAGGRRLDTILYEIAYCDYLLESYDAAQQLFSLSVDEGLAAVERGVQANSTRQARTNGADALAHIWVSGLLERIAEIRHHLHNIDRHRDTPVKRIGHLAGEIESIYRALSAACKAKPEEWSAKCEKAIKTIRPDWTPPAPLPRTERMEGPLERHLRNAQFHTAEVSCWLNLFGLKHRDSASHSEGCRELQAVRPEFEGLPEYRLRQVELLCRWTMNPDDQVDIEAISLAALLRAGGGFEYLGDLILLAWRSTSDSERKRTLAWYLENRVPTIGMNGVAKAALSRLSQPSA